MKLRKILTLPVFFMLLFTMSSFPQTSGIKKYHPFSGKLGLSLEGGPAYTLSDFANSEISYSGRFTGEYLFPSTQPGVWGLKGHAALGYLKGSGGATFLRPEDEAFKTTFVSLGGGAEYLLKVSNTVMPYVYAGAAYFYFDPNDLNGNPLLRNQQKKYSKNEWMLIGECGFKFLVSNNVSLNAGFNIDYVNVDNLDDIVVGTDNDVFFTAFCGVSLLLLGIDDSDQDGVADDDDICPQTPVGVIVNQFGCPVDTDNDGVADYLDNCAGTPANIQVDNNGCPVDSDGDGIPDYLDLCKDTPEGVIVDKRGCPFDEDGDGVPDYKDKCPGTDSGLEVNRWGCTPDDLSKELPEITSMVLSSGVNFETGKATLLPDAKTELDKMIQVMKKYPDSKWLVSGYTDNTGSYQLNKKLSFERAHSVAAYLIQNGIHNDRLEVKGFGSDNPIADNYIESGRALNRRVEINFIGNEYLSFDIPSNNEYNIKTEKHIGNMIFTDGTKYCFQVASFRTYAEAEKVAKKFLDKGENAFIIEANLPELDGTWYRVRIGYFDTISETKAVMDRTLSEN